MSVNWITDADEALNNAKEQKKPLLIDFSAAPDWGGCVRLEAESYADPEVSSFIHENFVPLHVHIKENPRNFKRFDAVWTPTVLVMDPEGEERWRLEGYLSKDEFEANLKMGLARVAFMKKDWPDAERRYAEVAEKYPDSTYAPEAVYYQGVSRYSASHDGADLAAVAKTFDEKYQDTEWAMRSRPWSSH